MSWRGLYFDEDEDSPITEYSIRSSDSVPKPIPGKDSADFSKPLVLSPSGDFARESEQYSLYCSGFPRSSGWAALSKEHLKKYPHCVVCGTTVACVPHHKVPYHVNRELELVETNLVTLCHPRCHLLIGHLGDFRSWNEKIDEIADLLRQLIATRPYK